MREAGGSLIVSLYNHQRGSTESFLVHQFDREDAVRVEINQQALEGGDVREGDTLAAVISADFRVQQATLSGNLVKAHAALDVARTGEKKALIEEAQHELVRARAEYDVLEKSRTRIHTLHESGIASQQELEQAESLADAARSALSSAEARVRVLSTGSKPEQVALSQSLITSLQEQDSALRRKGEFFMLRAPFAGRIFHAAFSDTLIRLGDTTTFVAVMTLPVREHANILRNASVDITVPGMHEKLSALLVFKSNVVQTHRGEQVFIAVAVIDRSLPEVLPGLALSCSVRCAETTLRSYLWQTITRWFSS